MLGKYQSNPEINHGKTAKNVCGMLEATIHALLLQNVILGLSIVDTITKQLKIYCNNTAVVFFSKNDKYSKMCQTYRIKVLYCYGRSQETNMLLENIIIDIMIADP